MNILANLSRYDYGKRALGSSFEYDTFFRYFQSAGHSVDLFDYTGLSTKHGNEKMNAMLVEAVRKQNYDLLFTVPLTDEFSNVSLQSIMSKHTGVPSVAWMCDDKWRWESYGKRMAFNFDYVVTTDPGAVQKYRSIDYTHAILSQWAHDPMVYKKMKTKKKYDVTFIGGISPWRDYLIKRLKKNGVDVHCFGNGWTNGRVSVEDTVMIYNQSSIVLNLSNSTRFDLQYFASFNPPQWQGSIKKTLFHLAPGISEYLISKKRVEDIKARFFEVTGAGAFLITYPVDYLDRYLVPGKDVETYASIDELLRKIRFYLSEPKKAAKIASKGYERTKKHHTYEKRFSEIFNSLGL